MSGLIVENIPQIPSKPAEKIIWYKQEIKLKDGARGVIEFDLDILAKEFGYPIKRIIVQKVPSKNNWLRIGLVINGPDVIVEEPTSNAKQKQTKGGGPSTL